MRIGWWIAIGFMLAGAAMDIRKKEISAGLLILFGLTAAIYRLVEGGKGWESILYSFVPGAGLLALSLCTRESIGYGDGWIVLILGLLMGFRDCMAIVGIGFLTCALFSLFLLTLRKVHAKTRLPFLPFLTIGLGVMMFAEKGM